jgi:hypothetical protein
MDLVVSKDPFDDKKVTKERWIYWKSKVNNSLSLTKDPFQKFGMLFETTNKETSMTKYPFLGM